ncbi:hypothetical protein ABB37_02093 [Leptomonas pyrrhocoris]|uniref:BAR domain-containing protein n=1 Tax=Leptomonas pyrrhocoris TaxID=157538 RepID=A0A0N0VGP6_LEPPY|nr:hypothetical protein ABB37_02093 [Leptomonas pyrrhocoris]XP_015662374.1 hypothetical protein ABB37_02093 [Leptomonas pyrrhocoris]KPA83934.1 hypothetical protein ABB37_02093 [Leptomonas pyrrhocoris]KPA83935.1 hypothetical protein ABB37_02093 [Leptomonas pyrrhocoris]|eukprot:XP_015662373.1 hypothetical protein ABB37_02093 [Leptomonas pyrrhocoris]
MGTVGSKISSAVKPSASIADVNPELDYRLKNLKRLKDALKLLKDNLAKAMTNMEGTPQRLKEVGGGYSAVTACMSYSGGGGVSGTRRAMTGADTSPYGSNEVSTVAVRQDDASDPVTAPAAAPASARMDRDLAAEALSASKKFCDAMEALSTKVYPKYSTTLQRKGMDEVNKLIALQARVATQGKKTVDCMFRRESARKMVAAREKANSKKGKDLMMDEKHSTLVSNRDSKERIYQTELEEFDGQYEDLMAQTQKFAAESTEVFLDTVVEYYREIAETIDYIDTPTRSRTRSRSAPANVDSTGNARVEFTSDAMWAEIEAPEKVS